MNTKYISSSELKTYKFSLVLRTRENSDVFNSLDEIYLVFTSKKQISSIYLAKSVIAQGLVIHKVQVGNDPENAQSERNSHSKTEVGKKQIYN